MVPLARPLPGIPHRGMFFGLRHSHLPGVWVVVILVVVVVVFLIVRRR
jgi:hypothetical protein